MGEWLSYALPAVFVISSFFSSLRYVHMLQLSSYQTPGYASWIWKNREDAFLPMLPLVLGGVFSLWDGWFAPAAACALMLLSAFLLRPGKKAKKPLVFTSRVIRLLCALAVILLGLALAAYQLRVYGNVWVAPLCTCMFFTAYLVMAANLITLPIQKLINLVYIRDAKKKLKAVPGLVVIGITGSYGKTSAKSFLHGLLSVKYNVLATPESYNTPMGVVRTIRERLEPSHQVFLCEMGARHVGDIEEICRIAKPRHGLITSIGPQHLETFHTIENIIKTKYELADALPSDGKLFLAWGGEHVRSRPADARTVRYGLGEGLDYTLGGLSADRRGSRFTVTARGGESREFTTPVLGRHQAENITGAIAVAHSMGIPLDSLAAPVMALESPPHRLRLIQGDSMTIIDDAFNSNPAGAAAALETLALFSGSRILVTPGMVELGGEEERLNREFGASAAKVCDYVALVGVRQTKPIAAGLKSAGFPTRRLSVFDSFGQAMDWVRALECEDKVVLLENDLPDNY